jgi:hypothetical protein
VYQLTPETEAVLAFVDSELADGDSFVGTECRLRLIIDLLDDVASTSGSDPTQQLARLKRQRDRIDSQITAIELGQRDVEADDTKIRERFQLATTLLSQLQSDFRAVEDRFKQVARQVHHRHAEGIEARGAILEYALDQEDQLKESDQGKSFLEFVRLVHAPERQERLVELIRELSKLGGIQSNATGLARLQGMLPMLIAEAEKILRTTQRLSQTLRRLLDARTSRQRQQLASVLREIQSLASRAANVPDKSVVDIAIDVDLEIQAPMERAFWSPVPSFESVAMNATEPDDEMRLQTLHQLASLNRLDWSSMRSRIRQVLKDHQRASLRQLLDAFPVQSGPIEVLGYVQIAHDDGHAIDASCMEELIIEDTEGTQRTFQIPRIEFVNRHDPD